MPDFQWKDQSFHSAVARYYAPSDLCGVGGMHRERICANASWSTGHRFDTVFVALEDAGARPMCGMLVARVFLFFSFSDCYETDIPCVLVTWFINTANEPDPDTGMWVVEPELDPDGQCSVQVLPLDSILRGAHLLPRYGTGYLPEDFEHIYALDSFRDYYVNHFVDHHSHELLT